MSFFAGVEFTEYALSPKYIEHRFLDDNEIPDLLITANLGKKSVYFGNGKDENFRNYLSLERIAEILEADTVGPAQRTVDQRVKNLKAIELQYTR